MFDDEESPLKKALQQVSPFVLLLLCLAYTVGRFRGYSFVKMRGTLKSQVADADVKWINRPLMPNVDAAGQTIGYIVIGADAQGYAHLGVVPTPAPNVPQAAPAPTAPAKK